MNITSSPLQPWIHVQHSKQKYRLVYVFAFDDTQYWFCLSEIQATRTLRHTHTHSHTQKFERVFKSYDRSVLLYFRRSSRRTYERHPRSVFIAIDMTVTNHRETIVRIFYWKLFHIFHHCHFDVYHRRRCCIVIFHQSRCVRTIIDKMVKVDRRV